MKQTIPPMTWTRLGTSEAWVYHESSGNSWVDRTDGRVTFGPIERRSSDAPGGWLYSMGGPPAPEPAQRDLGTTIAFDTTEVSG